jgi:hypothetical protein
VRRTSNRNCRFHNPASHPACQQVRRWWNWTEWINRPENERWFNGREIESASTRGSPAKYNSGCSQCGSSVWCGILEVTLQNSSQNCEQLFLAQETQCRLTGRIYQEKWREEPARTHCRSRVLVQITRMYSLSLFSSLKAHCRVHLPYRCTSDPVFSPGKCLYYK